MPSTPSKPLVSVIIPTYNRSGKLYEAVESVLAQDFRDFELIIVDDGSTDDSVRGLAAYTSIKLIRQSNRGVSAARNRGIAAARGRLIAFLDSDDLWMKSKLACQTAFFESHPATQICQTQEIWLRRGVRVNPKRKHQKIGGMIFEQSLPLCIVSPSAVMMRKGLLEEFGGFNEQLPACEDYDLWLRISTRYPIELIDTPLIVKRGGHTDQLSNQPGLDKYRIQSLVGLLEQHALTPSQRHAVLQTLRQKCLVYAGGCRRRGRISEALY